MVESHQVSSTNLSAPASAAVSTHPSGVPPEANQKVAAGPMPPGAYVSPWLIDIVKLVQAGIDQGVMLTFIDSAGTFNLDADQIIYLRDLKVSADVITAMMQHDSEIVSGLRSSGGAISGSHPGLHLTFVQGDSPGADAATQAHSAALSESTATTAEAEPVPGQLTPLVWREPPQQSQVLPTRALVSPVRLPYAVPLTDPIIMIQGEGRSPNLVVIELFP